MILQPTDDDLLQRFDGLCPNVIGNPYIPETHRPWPKQVRFLGMHLTHGTYGSDVEETFEALYGGAAGGGKSDVLLMAAAQYAWTDPQFAGLIFRRSLTDLEQPGALIARAMEWWRPAGVTWNGNSHVFRFPTGASVKMGYLRSPNDHLNYRGAEYQLIGWDELTDWADDWQYRFMLSRIRRLAGSTTPLRMLSTSNPGGPGHSWVKHRFLGGVNPTTGVDEPPIRPFLPALVQDNPALDMDAYIRTLAHLHPTTRDQLLRGDWDAREPGDYFRREWFGPLLDPAVDMWQARDCTRIRWWDLAASERDDAARTAGVRMARHTNGVRAIEHVVAGRWTPGKRDGVILQTAQADGPMVYVGLEIEGGSGGPAQFYHQEQLLRSKGFRVVGARPRADLKDREGKVLIRNPAHDDAKAARAAPVASCLERGFQRRGECEPTRDPWWGEDRDLGVYQQRDGIRLFGAPWTQMFLDEVEGFPGGATKDIVDATSGAWHWLEVNGPRLHQRPRAPHDSPSDAFDIHPADRAKPTPLIRSKAMERHGPL